MNALVNIELVRTEADRMRFAIDMERGNDRSPAQEELDVLEEMAADTGIRRVEQLLDGDMTRRVLTLTPEMWREMGPAERRVMLDWTVRRAKLFEQRSAFMSRNIVAGELVVPDALKVAT